MFMTANKKLKKSTAKQINPKEALQIISTDLKAMQEILDNDPLWQARKKLKQISKSMPNPTTCNNGD